MGDKIQTAYRQSKDIYDETLTQGSWWAKLYIRFFWGGVDDTEIADAILRMIPADFSGKLLDVPVGTGVFTAEKYRALPHAEITCLDYSHEMLAQAQERFAGAKLRNVQCVQGDVGQLPFPDEAFDAVLSMNGFHAFPDKRAAFAQTGRVLKKGGMFCGCFYIKGQSRRTDFVVKNVLAKKGWFTPPFYSLEELREVLNRQYSRVEMFHQKAMVYFKCVK